MGQLVFHQGILKDHVAFVTGGGTGITGGVARALAEAGANVALVSRSIEHLESAATAINQAREAAAGRNPIVREGAETKDQSIGGAVALTADVRNPDQIEKAIAAT